MPRIWLPGPVTLRFYSIDCIEPVHVHVKVQEAKCKVWVNSLEIVKSVGFKPHQENSIRKLVKKHDKKIRKVWNEHCCKNKKGKVVKGKR